MEFIIITKIFLNLLSSFPETTETVTHVVIETETVEAIETAIVETKIAAVATRTEIEAEKTENLPQTDHIRENDVSTNYINTILLSRKS